MLEVLKIGGSVLTDKSSKSTLDKESFEKVLDLITENSEELVLVHGAGSFGHPQAEKIGLREGTKDSFHEVYSAVMELNRCVVQRLEEKGVKTLPIHPLSSSFRREKEFNMRTDHIREAVEEGYLPVTHGGPVASRGSIKGVSGDLIAVKIAEKLGAERIGMCSSTGGVLDDEGKIIEKVRQPDDFPRLGTENEDVTGGIAAKVERLLETEIPAFIFGPEDLEKFLEGRRKGTEVIHTSES